MEKDLAAARKEAEQMAAKLGNAGLHRQGARPTWWPSPGSAWPTAEADIARLEARLAPWPDRGTLTSYAQ